MGILRRIGSAAVGAEAEAALGCGCWDVVVVVALLELVVGLLELVNQVVQEL